MRVMDFKDPRPGDWTEPANVARQFCASLVRRDDDPPVGQVNRPVGTGPFQLVDFEIGGSAIVQPFSQSRFSFHVEVV